jgi:hypothetical protein
MLWKTISRWALMAIAVPLAAVGARRLGEAVESRRGHNRASNLLRRSADALQGISGRSRRRRRWWR